MIKSNRNLSEIVNIGKLGPVYAEGRVCIDFTDPITGKTKERVRGKNHVFMDALRVAGWRGNISNMWTCLNDDGTAIDPDMPYLRGNTVAYGLPSLGSLGTYRGAYNAANQVLGLIALDSVQWKFQYDFTTTQGNDVAIKNAGLTRQFVSDTAGTIHNRPVPIQDFVRAGTLQTGDFTCDGRYKYSISTAGIVNKYDTWLGTSSTIDVSATTGTTSDVKTIGYNPATQEFYIYVYSSTAGNRKMYKFSDNTFSSLMATYSCSNAGTSFGPTQYPIYVYGAYAFFFASLVIYKLDFTSNTVATIIELPSVRNYAVENEKTMIYAAPRLYSWTVPLSDRYVAAGALSISSRYSELPVFDLATETFVAVRATGYSSSFASYNATHFPKAEHQLPCFGSSAFYTDAALTSFILPTPVTKTSANGMTVTYELEVFW
jgi:hypothetical protein